MLKKLEPLPAITSVQSVQSETLSQNSNSQPTSKINTKPTEQETSIPNNNIFQKPHPIGIYNFSGNKTYISSLEQNVDEAVSAFIDQNRTNIIKYVVQEVQKKLEEKIAPMTEEISKLKIEFNSLYEEEWNEFKQSNVLNDCHNDIMELENKMNIMNENINKYNDNIKGFNIADNRLQFLNKLNKDLDEFIYGIGQNSYPNENKNWIPRMGVGSNSHDENLNKIEKEMNKQENLNQELDSVFYETMEMLKELTKDNDLEENKNNMNLSNNIMNCCDILNNFKNTVNAFDTKFNYEKPFNNNSNPNMKNNSNGNSKNDIKNYFDDLPNFFD